MTNPDPHSKAQRHLSAACPRLAELIASVGPCRLRPPATSALAPQEAFESIAASIVSQQLSTKAADTIYKRVLALGDGTLLPPDELMKIPDEPLRAAGLSGQKVRYLRDLCEKVSTGALVLGDLHTLSDEDVIERLCAVKGVGRWTAEMFLMFRLGRPDVLPVADFGIQQGMKKLYGWRKDPTPDRMHKAARAWKPYRSIACWYVWRHHERTK